MQPLQRAHRAVARALERVVEGILNGVERRQARGDDRRELDRHRLVIGEAQPMKAIHECAG